MSYEALDLLPPIFFPSDGNIDKELFTPLASNSSSLDCMVGYFTSGVLSELSHAIAAYLKVENNEPMRFIVSPHLNQNELAAIEAAYESGDEYFSLLFPDDEIKESSLRTYTVAALVHLILSGRLQLKVALKKDGLFHVKSWIFNTVKGKAAVHGSSNATMGGLLKNFEQLALDCAWQNDRSKQVVDTLNTRFEKIWSSKEKDIEILDLNEATIRKIRSIAVDSRDIERFVKKYSESNKIMSNKDMDEEHVFEPQQLKIPDYINYHSGEYSHQGEAVDAWFNNDRKGILSIATGGGKTYTSLIAAALLAEKVGSLFVVIAVPTRALMNQWEGDISEFGLKPINTNGFSASKIRRSIRDSLRNLRLETSKTEVLIVTHYAMLSDAFEENAINSSSVHTLLVVDELHNIGSAKSQKQFPTHFDSLIGLSATYERQFDQEGTDFLLNTFGNVVYEYGLDRAIGACLVNYNYFAHFVYLSAEEEDEFSDLTYEIRRLSYAANEESGSAKERWQFLCLKRRALIENAENKVQKLSELLPTNKNEIQKTLIFCTDKAPQQLKDVNSLLVERGVNFHQITDEETSNNRLLKKTIDLFSKDQLQVLTSKRVLDEGFNVPQTETAYLLASNTVVRQWKQRLGRVLRLSKSTGKQFASIHDFVVLPLVEGEADSDLKALLDSEYKRVAFFSKYSKNYMDKNGGYEATQELLRLMGAL
ncbi:MAG TPA: DEAD/DEAH box helicase family protein [Marinilabiliaceae bacterium]|nr:DEAD/DEAH box helicase family protein [Marinilabiliaceae bacterium]